MALPYFVRYVLCPLAIMLGTPTVVIIFSHIIQNLNGSVAMTYNEIKEFGPLQFIAQQCILNNLPTINHFISIFAFYLFQIVLYYIVPGKTVHGPPTSTGYVPKYKQNGVATYSISLTFVMIGYFVFGIPFHELINHIAPLSIAILIASLIVTVLLMFCALCCPENPSDVKSSGNWIMDYYSGLELYPYWFGINCKQLINSRIGMTQWALVCLCHICKDYDNMKQLSKTNELLFVSDYVYILSSPVFISGVLQIIYLFKFFWWEIGYFATIDVQHDRCGFMICWGCLCWVFGVYTFHTSTILSNKLFQSQEKNDPHCLTMNGLFACIIFVIGVLSIYINYECDAQKMRVRESNGNCKIFGKKAEIIRATYVSEAGKNKKSILLVSGYWGFARHFHYVPELMFAFTICVPGITLQTGLQLFYFFFLILLLADRTGRDDDRCSKKYTKYWKLYCKQVKYKMIPYVW